jgi:hypothetical protein
MEPSEQLSLPVQPAQPPSASVADSPPPAPEPASPASSEPPLRVQESAADLALGDDSDDNIDIDDSHVTPEAEAAAAEAIKAGAKTLNEVADAAKGKPAEPGQPAAPTPGTVDPAKLDWKTLDDVQKAFDSGAIPEPAKPYVQDVLHKAQLHHQMVLEAVDSYGRSEATFKELCAKLEKADPSAGVAMMADQYGKQVSELDSMGSQLIDVSWQLFYAQNPGYEKAPDQVKTAFAGLLEDGSLYRMFSDAQYPSLTSKMQAALDYVCFKTNTRLGSPAPTSTSPATPMTQAPVAPVSRNKSPTAKAASAINDGGQAPTPARRDIEDVPWEELMDRNDYVLDQPSR